MSKPTAPTRCLVVDASVAQSAGSIESRHPTGIFCRDFLMKLRGVGHRMAWTEAIKDEWDRHRSSFALSWLVSMERLGKLRRVTSGPTLSDGIKACGTESAVEAVLLKDSHLVEAALATDSRVASRDDTVRGHFTRVAQQLDVLGAILWVNPAAEGEGAVAWLDAGAPDERARRLRAS